MGSLLVVFDDPIVGYLCASFNLLKFLTLSPTAQRAKASRIWWLLWTGTEKGVGLETFQRYGRGFLRRGPGRGLGETRQAEIFNAGQGSRFTGFAFSNALWENGIRISMDGRDRWLDTVIIERLWRSLKYECVYLHAVETGSEARTGIGKWIGFYNRLRSHGSLGPPYG